VHGYGRGWRYGSYITGRRDSIQQITTSTRVRRLHTRWATNWAVFTSEQWSFASNLRYNGPIQRRSSRTISAVWGDGGSVVRLAACGPRSREFDAHSVSSCPMRRDGLSS